MGLTRLGGFADFLDASLGKIIRLRKKLDQASSAIKGLFGTAEGQSEAVQKLEAMQASSCTAPQGSAVPHLPFAWLAAGQDSDGPETVQGQGCHGVYNCNNPNAACD